MTDQAGLAVSEIVTSDPKRLQPMVGVGFVFEKGSAEDVPTALVQSNFELGPIKLLAYLAAGDIEKLRIVPGMLR